MAKKTNIDLIKSILADKYIDPIQNKLVEDKSKDAVKPFVMERNVISHHDINEYVLYRFDPDNEDIFPFFKRATGLKKICDYILFVEQGRSLYILLIEMKLGNISSRKQLDASELFVNYILNSAERVNCKISDYHIRKIRICDRKSRGKRQTKPKDLEYDQNYLDYNTVRDFRIKELLF
ncbi:MAG: hypothetical protein ACK5KL_07205 [Dysgonomonas sp.]